MIADASNWRVGTPALSTSLRGLVDCTVSVRTLTYGVHSGSFGGIYPEAITCLAHTLAGLHNEDGSVAVEGLVSAHADPLDFTIDEADTEKTWALWIGDSPKVLKDQMEDAAPGIGSLIYISYKGKRDTKDGSRSYHVHSVEAQTRDFELWSELTKERAQKALGAGSYGGGDNGIPANAPDESPF